MKTNLYIAIFLATFGFYGCIHNGNFLLPVDTLSSARLKLVNYPTNSSNYILGAGDYIKEVDFILRDCFTNEYISCTDSLGNIKDYIILYLGEGDYADGPGFLENMGDLLKEDGNEYYVKIYLAQHKKIDYEEQQSNPLNYLDTIEFDIDYNAGMIQYITIKNDDQWVWYKGKRIPSYRILQFWPYKI